MQPLFPKFVFGKPRSRRSKNRIAESVPVESLEPRVLLSATSGPSSHHAVMNLVSAESVTHTAVQSGAWSDPETWAGQDVPTTGANVLIPEGTNVKIVSDQSAESLSTIRVDGKLRFGRARDSHLAVETIVVTATGRLEIGTAKNPIPNNRDVRVTFTNSGNLTPESDPLSIGRGLIVMGSISVAGSQVTAHAQLESPALKGDRVIHLTNASHNWEKGDEIVVPGLQSGRNRDEEFVIKKVENNKIHLKGKLRFDHDPPLAELAVHVANMTRNVTFASANPAQRSERGHIMLMHTNKVSIENAAFNGLGRSDKRTQIEDAQFDDDGNLVAGTGLNQRGRYAVHFHQTGPDRAASLFRGNAVTDTPGWGVVNHSSNVDVIDNVVYHATGSAFVTEGGDEVGRYQGNMAIRSLGSGDGLMERTDVQDFGHLGNGFWFQGTGIEVSDNIAVGHANVGFIYFVQGLLQEDGSRTEFLTENLSDKSLDNGERTIDPRRVPIPLFVGNTAIGVGDGFQSWFHLQPRKGPKELEVVTPGQTVIDRLTVWNATRRAMHFPYSNGITVRDSVLIGSLDSPSRQAVGRNDNTENIRFENVRIEGWEVGIDMPVRGVNEVVGGQFRNVTNIRIPMGRDFIEYGVSVIRDKNGDSAQFLELSEEQLAGREQQDIDLEYKRTLNHNNINSLFVPTTIHVDTDQYDNQQLFFRQQAADFVPFEKSGGVTPEAFVGKTNAELFDEFGLAVGGSLAPTSATLDRSVNAFVGDPIDAPAAIAVHSDRYPDGDDYYLTYSIDGQKTRESTPTEIVDGWNLLTRDINGSKRTIAVFGDSVDPRFKLQPITPRMLNPLDRDATIYVVGQILDDSLARRTYKRPFDLSQFKLRTEADGREYVMVRFNAYDRSGNSKSIRFKIHFDANTPPLYELYRNDIGERSIPEMLLE